MKSLITAALTLGVGASLFAGNGKEPWRDPTVSSINRLPARAIAVPCEDAAKSLAIAKGEKAVTDSKWILSLDGEWDFQWKANVYDKDWAKSCKIAVPGCWQLQGDFDPPVYANGEYLPKNPLYHDAIVERQTRMIRTFCNHPSIIFWSLGNESGDGPAMADGYKAIKALDSTRPVQYEGAQDSDHSDIKCPMYHRPWDCENYVKNNPKKPFILCEYIHAMGNSTGDIGAYWKLANIATGFGEWSAKIGLSVADDQLNPNNYVEPGEMGYRTDCDWVELKDEGAITVNIDAAQMGVGGDDSWGAKPHDQHMLGAGEYKLSFLNSSFFILNS